MAACLTRTRQQQWLRFDRIIFLVSWGLMKIFTAAMISLGLFATICMRACADSYTYVDEQGQRTTIEAQSIGSGQGFTALERRDGQLQIVPSTAIVDRAPGDGPEPFDRSQMTAMLKERFGEDLIRIQEQGSFIIGLVLTAPIERSSEGRANAFIQKASRFMNKVDDVFIRYAKLRSFPLREPKYPLVLLIFESEEDFDEYTREATGATGLSAANIAGFYTPITNWLAVRMSSCDSFEVPLHEAIHQQMYNRVLQRLAPVPKWFDEGIATGFEGDGERITISPAKVNPRYAAQAQALSGRVNWKTVIENDGAFTADVLAGEAYTLAWCMHWLLANHHEDEYEQYVNELASRKPLESLDSAERLERFRESFNVSVGELQSEFPDRLDFAIKRQKVRPKPTRTDGGSSTMQALGQVDLKVVANARFGNQLAAEGLLKNMSPLRPMTFYVTVEAGDGSYTDWTIADVSPGRKVPLSAQRLSKRFNPAIRMPIGSYKVFVRSAPADSRKAEVWSSGNVPGPLLAR